jgi:alpha-L-fucosidase
MGRWVKQNKDNMSIEKLEVWQNEINSNEFTRGLNLMNMIFKTILKVAFLFFWSCSLWAQNSWENPIQKQGGLGSPLVATSPFVFNDKLYLLENNQRFWDVPGAKPGYYFHEDEIRIREIATDKIIPVPLKNHGFGTVLTWEERVYVFAGNYGQEIPWREMTGINMTSSKDLKNWTNHKRFLGHPAMSFFQYSRLPGKRQIHSAVRNQ